MIDRALFLREVILWSYSLYHQRITNSSKAIDTFLDSRDFTDLQKYHLEDCEWKALEAFKTILQVRYHHYCQCT